MSDKMITIDVLLEGDSPLPLLEGKSKETWKRFLRDNKDVSIVKQQKTAMRGTVFMSYLVAHRYGAYKVHYPVVKTRGHKQAKSKVPVI